jgi:hypothetical protein
VRLRKSNDDLPFDPQNWLAPLPPWQSLQGILSRLGLFLIIAALVVSLPDWLDGGAGMPAVLRQAVEHIADLLAPISQRLPSALMASNATIAVSCASLGLALLTLAENTTQADGSRATSGATIVAIACLGLMAAFLFGRSSAMSARAPLVAMYGLAALATLWRLPPSIVVSRVVTAFSGTAAVAFLIILLSAPLSGGVF